MTTVEHECGGDRRSVPSVERSRSTWLGPEGGANFTERAFGQSGVSPFSIARETADSLKGFLVQFICIHPWLVRNA